MRTLIDFWLPDRVTILEKEENTPLSQPQLTNRFTLIDFLLPDRDTTL
jgi:hypothetical protein